MISMDEKSESVEEKHLKNQCQWRLLAEFMNWLEDHCYLCQNQCMVNMALDDEGTVVEVWRADTAANKEQRKQCKRLTSELIGKDFLTAIKIIRRPVAIRVVGGH